MDIYIDRNFTVTVDNVHYCIAYNSLTYAAAIKAKLTNNVKTDCAIFILNKQIAIN